MYGLRGRGKRSGGTSKYTSRTYQHTGIESHRRSIDGINVYSPSLQPLRGELYLGHIINETSQYIWSKFHFPSLTATRKAR